MKKILLILAVFLCGLTSCDTAEIVTYGGGYEYNYFYDSYPVVIIGGRYYYRYYFGGQYLYEPVPSYYYNRIIGHRVGPKVYSPRPKPHPNRNIRNNNARGPKPHISSPRQNVRQIPNRSVQQGRSASSARRR